MKNRGMSIRMKFTLWFAAALTVITALTFFAVRFASETVLRGTVRDYLIAMVEENAGKIRFSEKKEREGAVFIPYGQGSLEIDEDFLEVVNDVSAALYDGGDMLYGENPLARQTEDMEFMDSRIWSITTGGVRYDIYDRKLIGVSDEGELWIRGVVSEEKNAAQLRRITQLSLIFLPVLIVLAAFLAYMLADRLLSPVRRIERAAASISGGDDLKARIDEGRSNDEIGRLAKVINAMFDRLERSFEAERQFTSDVSHELRTPAAVILAQCEYTLEKPRDEEEYINSLQVVERQGRRMSGLISDMLDYTRMEQGAERYPLESTSLSDAVAEAAEQAEAAAERGITLVKDIEPDIFINGNKMLLMRLAENLISNAYRYGKDGGVTKVILKRTKDGARFAVKDDGIGMDEKDMERIFDRFYRADSSRTVKGTGLGLSMVKRIAEIHGADISVESELDKGSSFYTDFKNIF